MAITGTPETSLPNRCDLSAPATVFGAVFIAAIAICGTLGAVSPTVSPVKDDVLTDEHVVGPQGIDPLAMACDHKEPGKDYAKNCQKKRGPASQD